MGMALWKKLAQVFAFLLAANVLIGIGSASVFAGEKNVWADKNLWKRASERIVRLPPSAFPQLPEAIQRDLGDRGGLIPQPVLTGSTLPPDYEGRNVISGEFRKPGQTDWAVLCSTDSRSAILVFWNASVDDVEQLGDFSPDKGLLQGMGVDRETQEPLIEYSRGISSVGKDYILRYFGAHGGPQPPPIDHEGIKDAFIGKASWVLYWHEGDWLDLQGAD